MSSKRHRWESRYQLNRELYVATESGKVLTLNLNDFTYTEVFQDPSGKTMMGLVIRHGKLYFGGHTFIGFADINDHSYTNFYTRNFYRQFVEGLKFRLLNKLTLKEAAIRYGDPAFHRMNIYNNRLYVAATGCNEVWEMDLELNLNRRIVIQPHICDYNHLNNVFFDGKYYYVGLMRYCRRFGYAGYAKFDCNWIEIERRQLGWEAHSLCVIGGDLYNLCSSGGSRHRVYHPHRAGIMINGALVFEHDPDKYYCKDFAIDDDYIYIVGGEVSTRGERKKADAVLFILDTDYKLLNEIQFKNTGGFSGCRLPEKDYTNGPSL